jgi:hypothetical protein
MTRPTFHIGTLALLAATAFCQTAPNRHTPRSLPRDQARHRSTWCVPCQRTPAGRIKRSSAARRQFQRAQPCPSTGSTRGACPSYVADHIIPLKHGGPDTPENMQWQTSADAHAKDRAE